MKIKSTKLPRSSIAQSAVEPVVVDVPQLPEDRPSVLMSLAQHGGAAPVGEMLNVTGGKDPHLLAQTIKQGAIDGLLLLAGDKVSLTSLGMKVAGLAMRASPTGTGEVAFKQMAMPARGPAGKR